MIIWRMRIACWIRLKKTHTLRICNTWVFTPVIMVSRILIIIITLYLPVRYLSCIKHSREHEFHNSFLCCLLYKDSTTSEYCFLLTRESSICIPKNMHLCVNVFGSIHIYPGVQWRALERRTATGREVWLEEPHMCVWGARGWGL